MKSLVVRAFHRFLVGGCDAPVDLGRVAFLVEELILVAFFLLAQVVLVN